MNDQTASVRPPQQDRSRATLARLVSTTRDMLADTEWRELSVTELCQRASSSVGSFYARFAGKDALLDTLAVEARLELADLVDWCAEDARRRGLPLTSRLRQLTAALFRYTDRQGGVLRALAAEGWPQPWSDPAVRRTLGRIMSNGGGGAERGEEALAVLLAVCGARAAALHERRGPDPEALSRMLALYLGG